MSPPSTCLRSIALAELLNEEAEPPGPVPDGEEIHPAAAAVREVLADSGAEPTRGRIGNGHGLQLDRIVLLGIRRRVSAVVPADDVHGDLARKPHPLASLHVDALRCGQAFCLRLQAGGKAADDRRSREGGPGGRVVGVVEVAVTGEQVVEPAACVEGLPDAQDVGKVDAPGSDGVLQPATSTEEEGLRWNAREVSVHDAAKVAKSEIPVCDRHPGQLDVGLAAIVVVTIAIPIRVGAGGCAQSDERECEQGNQRAGESGHGVLLEGVRREPQSARGSTIKSRRIRETRGVKTTPAEAAQRAPASGRRTAMPAALVRP